ncbi:MAG: hypothetical protein IN808_00120, partial [Rubrobacter sp.]|nr:hypothetical protein [Rubrobacter sp.]
IGDWDALSLEDYLAPDAVTFIEWADPALGILENPTVIRLEHESPRTRRVRIEGPVAERMGC